MQLRPDAASEAHRTPSPRLEAFARWVTNWRLLLLLIGVGLMAAAYRPAQRLQFDRQLENMFAEDDPLLVPYRRAKAIFGDDEIALAAYVDPELMTPSGMKRLAEATAKLAAVPGVKSVVSLNNSPLGDGIIDADNPLAQSFVELFEGYTVSADRTTTAVICLLAPSDTNGGSREETVDGLRAAIDDYGGVVTGEPVMIVDGFRYLEDDSVKLGWIATALLVFVIFVSFRSIRWVIVPVATVMLTLLVTKAILVVGGFRLTMVSSMLWAIIFVIGISAVVHVIIRFREERNFGRAPVGALQACIVTLALPMLWTCLSDVGGFGSLIWAKVGPIQDFGTMMTIASFVSIFSILLMVPGLSVGGRVDPDPKRAWGERGLDLGLGTISELLNRYPRTIGLLAALTAGVAMLGSVWLTVETDFTKNFRKTSPLVRSYVFIEERLGGAGVWDLFLPAPEQPTWEFMAQVRRLEKRLRDEIQVLDEQGQSTSGLTKVFSIVDAIDALGLGAAVESFAVTDMVEQMRGQMPAIVDVLQGRDPATGENYLRIMLRAKERQPSAQKQQMIDDVTRISREEFGPGAQVTGFFVLLTQLINSILRDQWVTFGLASAAIGAMMLVAFRSIPLALVAMVPNNLPIMIVTGVMGWLGVEINMGAAMIAAVSMGLSVDSSVHYITEYLEARREGYSSAESLARVHQRVGRAVVFSTAALVMGFSALIWSQFIPLVYFGALMGLTMVGGSIGNLVVLPLLLKLLERFHLVRIKPA